MSRLDAIWFRNFRIAHRMSQGDLARVLGVRRPTICLIENNHRAPSRETVRRFEALIKKHEENASAEREADSATA